MYPALIEMNVTVIFMYLLTCVSNNFVTVQEEMFKRKFTCMYNMY